MNIKIDRDTKAIDLIEKAIQISLRETYDMLGQPTDIPIFSCDPDIEAQEVKKIRKAFRKVHNWYSIAEDHL